MKILSTFVALSAVFLLFAAVPVVATEPAIHGSTITYLGAGKHPKTGVSGLIIDGNPRGPIFVCYDYTVITNDKIKGQVSAIAERISGNRVEKIATYRSTRVQAFDFNQIPPGGGDNQCLPDIPDGQLDFNLGVASDCVQITTPLAADDIVRWSFKFKKGSKLKGNAALLQVSGSVVPLASLSRRSAREAGSTR